MEADGQGLHQRLVLARRWYVALLIVRRCSSKDVTTAAGSLAIRVLVVVCPDRGHMFADRLGQRHGAGRGKAATGAPADRP